MRVPFSRTFGPSAPPVRDRMEGETPWEKMTPMPPQKPLAADHAWREPEPEDELLGALKACQAPPRVVKPD